MTLRSRVPLLAGPVLLPGHRPGPLTISPPESILGKYLVAVFYLTFNVYTL